MNVNATDKGTSRSEKITISNSKGRLSQDEVERLIKEAEKYKDQDEKMRKKVEAKNGLEGYCVQVKHTLEDEKMKDKIDSSDRETIKPKVEEVERWLSSNQDSDVDAFEAKQKELEAIFNPIMSKVYQSAGAAGAGGPAGAGYPGREQQYSGGQPSGPQVDEVD